MFSAYGTVSAVHFCHVVKSRLDKLRCFFKVLGNLAYEFFGHVLEQYLFELDVACCNHFLCDPKTWPKVFDTHKFYFCSIFGVISLVGRYFWGTITFISADELTR